MITINFGAIAALIEDEKVQRITVNSNHSIHYWHDDTGLESAEKRFDSEQDVQALAMQLAQSADMPFDYQHPITEIRLDSGIRAMLVNRYVSSTGTVIHFEKPFDFNLTTEKFVSFGALSQQSAEFLQACIKGHRNIAFIGGHLSGRQAGMNAVIRHIGQRAPIVIVQPQDKIHLPDHTNVIKLESQSNQMLSREGLNNKMLVETAMRLKPHRLIIAEIDGTEVATLLSLIYDGVCTMFSMRSLKPEETLRKLETMTSANDLSRPVLAIREQIADSLDLIVHVDLMYDGFQRFVSISAIEGMQGDTITLTKIFDRENGMSGGDLLATGQVPNRLIERVKHSDVEVDMSLFEH